MRKLTQEMFIDRATAVHSNKYDYADVVYINSSTKITIRCKEHGVFSQLPYAHLSGKGCPACAASNAKTLQLLSNEEFINRCKDKYGDRFTYEKTAYTGAKNAVVVTDKTVGDIMIRAERLLRGAVRRDTANDEADYIANATAVHGGAYMYSSTLFVGKFVQVVCKVHGEVLINKKKHLLGAGCPRCAECVAQTPKRLTTEKFVNKAKEVHGNKYTYEKTTYGNNNRDKVAITCPRHGTFLQAPEKHLSGRGCPLCRNAAISLARQEASNGWSYTEWQRAGSVSTKFDSYKVYLILCNSVDGSETFIKVGKTFTTVANRFSTTQAMPYAYTVLGTVTKNAYAISVIETKIKKLLSEYRYVPQVAFAGMYECFSVQAKERAQELLMSYHDTPDSE